MSNYQRPSNGVVPKLVSDINLKRARVETETGDAIQTTIVGDVTNPLPVIEKSSTTQWFVRGTINTELRYYPLQWFCASPQPIIALTHNYGNNKWILVSPKANVVSPGDTEPNLPKKAYYFSVGPLNTFPGGWVAGITASNITNIHLLAYKAGNTDLAHPDLEVSQSTNYFEWEGDDFYGCEKQLDTATLYLNNVGGGISDAAWGGSGNGTVISLLKGIANIF